MLLFVVVCCCLLLVVCWLFVGCLLVVCWLFVGCLLLVAVGCCWLLLVVVGCCWLLLLVGTPLFACVCTLRMTRTCKLAAICTPCRPGDVGLRSPEINLHRSWDEQDCLPNHADCTASFCNQHMKYQNTQNIAVSSKHVDEHA